jgi:hypothetical protein
MSRALKLFILASIGVMTLVLAAFCWTHWDAIANFGALDPDRKHRLSAALMIGAFAPAWIALAAFITSRQLAQRDLQLAQEHRRFYETSMVVAVLFTAAAQAWFTFGAAYAPLAGPNVFLRVMLVFAGGFTMVYGNFNAKVPPPSGALAPAPAVWVRGMLRNGWAMVLLGLAEVVLAVVLPFELLRIFGLVVIVPAMLIVRAQMRLMWPRRRPQPAA